ncbi:Phosphoethanolamine N-methyltransferase 3-like 2 [Homarus americanus]|uniref:phosphoethanolamine N-methyltransferase n=2 Tax=Homarus americanus TaxID=6706 RepID=A0A8J5JX75_HOMAM|nr:Phosphoethanolamine N-methyltransferase 3-like 2 [Homarus americanus]
MEAGRDCVVEERAEEEVMVFLPDLAAKRVLYLNATRSFVYKLAAVAAHVTAVDSMQHNANEKLKDHHVDNVTFKCDDVTKLDFPSASFDLVCSSKLFENLHDPSASNLMSRVLSWLTPGGHFFLREKSYHPSVGKVVTGDGRVYRNGRKYCGMLHATTSPTSALNVTRGKNLVAYIASGDPCEVCLLAERVERETTEQLMETRYSLSFILKLEWIFGHTWVSTGGEATTREFCGHLKLRPGQRVLDVGCGAGGSAFFMARHYGIHIHGVDLSTSMINLSIDRQENLNTDDKKRIQFEICDIMKAEYASNTYDVIYSRDSILHIPNKDKLFPKLYRWLKPGGTLFTTDYFRGTGRLSQEFLSYEKKSCSAFVTMETYGATLRAAGFKEVKEQDLCDKFYDIQKEELDSFTSTREAFVDQYSQEDFDVLVNICSNKLGWVKSQQFVWGAFTAKK